MRRSAFVVLTLLSVLAVQAQEYDGRSLSAWVQQLRSADPAERARAASAIGTIAAKPGGDAANSAIPALIQLLADGDDHVRWQATSALDSFGKRAATAAPALLERLRDPSWTVRQMALSALVKIRPPGAQALGEAQRLLREDPERGVRASAAEAVRRLAEPAAAAASLQAAIGDADWQIRVRACQELAALGVAAKSAVPAMVGVLVSHPEGLGGGELAMLRQAVAEALGKMGPEAKVAVPALTPLLADHEFRVRQTAARALVGIGESAAAVPVLAEGLAAPDVSARLDAAQALRDLGPAAAPATDALVKALADPELLVRTYAVDALGEIGPPAKRAIPALEKLLGDGNLRPGVEAALQKIQGK